MSTLFITVTVLTFLVLTWIGWLETGPVNAFIFMLFIYAFWYSLRLVFVIWSGITSHKDYRIKIVYALLFYPVVTALILYSTFIIAGTSLSAAIEISDVTGSELITSELLMVLVLLTTFAVIIRRKIQVPNISKKKSHALQWAISLYGTLFVSYAVYTILASSDQAIQQQTPPALLAAVYLQYIAQHIMLNTSYVARAVNYSKGLGQRTYPLIPVIVVFLPIWLTFLIVSTVSFLTK